MLTSMKIKPLAVGQITLILQDGDMPVVVIPSIGKPLQFDDVATANKYLARLRFRRAASG
jgi:hypothetical protein